jgi:hypothetical protein
MKFLFKVCKNIPNILLISFILLFIAAVVVVKPWIMGNFEVNFRAITPTQAIHYLHNHSSVVSSVIIQGQNC